MFSSPGMQLIVFNYYTKIKFSILRNLSIDLIMYSVQMFRSLVSITTVLITRMARTRRSKTWRRRRRMMMKRNALWMLTSWRRAGLWLSRVELRRKGAELSPGPLHRGSITRTWRVGSPSLLMHRRHFTFSISPSSHLLSFFLLATRGEEPPELRPVAQEPVVLRCRSLSTVGAAAGDASTPPSNQSLYCN